MSRPIAVVSLALYSNALRGPIPTEVTGMTALEDFDFSFNVLSTNDPATRAFINARQWGEEDFETMQTPDDEADRDGRAEPQQYVKLVFH